MLLRSDPHFHTHDGTSYSFHGECDLVMAKSKTFGDGLGLDVHARTAMIDGTWSLISNAAVKIGDDIFELENGGTHYLNGASDIFFPTQIAGRYNVSMREENVESNNDEEATSVRTWYTIDLEDGQEIRISNYKKMIGVNVNENFKDAVGMLGSSSKDGLVGRDGEAVMKDPNAMGLEWQVRDDEPMLFHEVRAPQFPEQCILPSGGTKSRRLRQSDEKYRRAKEVCSGVSDMDRFDFCVEDVLLTGDVDAAKIYDHAF